MAKKWIKNAINPEHKGELKAKAERAGESTAEFAHKHASGDSKTAKQSRLALTLMSMHHGKKKEGPKRPTVQGLMKKMHGTKSE